MVVGLGDGPHGAGTLSDGHHINASVHMNEYDRMRIRNVPLRIG